MGRKRAGEEDGEIQVQKAKRKQKKKICLGDGR